MRTLAVISIGALLGACASPDNTRTTIGNGRLGDPSHEITIVSHAEVALTDAGPSVSGLDRSAWDRYEFVVPNDHTEHHPHFTALCSATGTDYQGAVYPTLDTAFGVERSASGAVVEWLLWPYKLVRDDLLSVGQIAGSEAGVTYSPKSDTYERTGG